MMLESCSWLALIQQKKELSKSDGLGPRYKQSCGVGVHVDISTQRQEGGNDALVSCVTEIFRLFLFSVFLFVPKSWLFYVNIF